MWFDNIDIRADYRRYDGYLAGVAPTREHIARERRIEEIRQREIDRKAELTLPLMAMLARMAVAIAHRTSQWRRPPARAGMEPLHRRGLRL